MLLFQHILPEKHGRYIIGRSDRYGIQYACWSIRPFVSDYWMRIPHSQLQAWLMKRRGVNYLTFRKEGDIVFQHVFCVEDADPAAARKLVNALYPKGQKRILPRPYRRCWIHSIPIGDKPLSKKELRIIYQVARHIYAWQSSNARARIEIFRA